MKNLLLAVLLLAAGCQTSGYYGSEQTFAPPSPFEKALVDEAAAALTRAFPPGKTTFYFPHKKQRFATDLENRLRRSGYAFRSEFPVGDEAKETTEIGYKLDGVGSDQSLVVLRLVAGDAWQMSRVYQRQKDGTIRPSGPLLIRKG